MKNKKGFKLDCHKCTEKTTTAKTKTKTNYTSENCELDFENSPWYHGMKPEKDVETILTEPGAFLVRSNENSQYILSFCNNSNVVQHFIIQQDSRTGKFYMPQKPMQKFAVLQDLLAYFQEKTLFKNFMLTVPVNRELWIVKDSRIVFDRSNLLGSGNFCDVFKGRFAKSNGDFEDVAIKVCHPPQSDKDKGDKAKECREAMANLVREGQIMSFYDHENVIRFYGVSISTLPFKIVMEFCSGGGLDYHLKHQGAKVTVGERILYCYEASKGMAYLHIQKCIHRDLAARNCLISSNGTIKISDFGLSEIINANVKEVLNMQIPVRWMAPESLVRTPVFSTSTDVWSFGVLMYEIFNNGGKPWPDFMPKKIATRIRKITMPAFPDNTPPEIKKLVAKIWIRDADKRPTMPTIAIATHKMLREKYPPPSAETCTVNKLPGVKRESTEISADAAVPCVDTPKTMEDTDGNAGQDCARELEKSPGPFPNLSAETDPKFSAEDIKITKERKKCKA